MQLENIEELLAEVPFLKKKICQCKHSNKKYLFYHNKQPVDYLPAIAHIYLINLLTNIILSTASILVNRKIIHKKNVNLINLISHKIYILCFHLIKFFQ